MERELVFAVPPVELTTEHQLQQSLHSLLESIVVSNAEVAASLSPFETGEEVLHLVA